jgi:hypothetical protein
MLACKGESQYLVIPFYSLSKLGVNLLVGPHWNTVNALLAAPNTGGASPTSDKQPSLV